MKNKFHKLILDMPVADTQYPFTFPANVEKFSIRLRDPAVALRVSDETGKVAGSTDPYWSRPAADKWEVDDLRMEDTKTFYFATASATQKLEITFWTGIRRSS